VRTLAFLLALFILAGCTSPRPLDAKLITDARWRTVIDTYTTAVNAARSDPLWHHHWLGNAAVLNQGPPHQGLCWQWRDHLDTSLASTLASAHLSARGIHARRGTRMEHNALLIFDPAAMSESALLTAAAPSATSPPTALVFDPWFSGTAAIYSIPEWSRLSIEAHPVGIDSRPFPVGQLPPPTRRDASPAW
jgi:hypothetical protein